MSKQTDLFSNDINFIREKLLSGKPKTTVAKELGISYNYIKRQTEDIPTSNRISRDLEQKIRTEVLSGKDKKRVARELDVSYCTVLKYTSDIPRKLFTPDKRKQQIRKQVESWKYRKGVAKDLGISYSTVCKCSSGIMRVSRIPSELVQKIKEQVNSGKTKKQVASDLGVSYEIVSRNTKNMRVTHRIPAKLEQQIRVEVRSGKTKKQVANELGISYKTVRRYTRDISTILRIPIELEQKIRHEVKNGKLKSLVADELNISRRTVYKYTKDLGTRNSYKVKLPSEQIEEIIANVIKYNSKLETARKMGIPYESVIWYTKDIKIKCGISNKLKKQIREDVLNGKSKSQVARDRKVSRITVYNVTQDIITGKKRNFEKISGLALELLKELMEKGYVLGNKEFNIDNYRTLKKKFPNILRVNLYNRVIFFLEEHKDEAMRAFLENANKKIISYQELQKIINVFDGNIDKKDKKKYISTD